MIIKIKIDIDPKIAQVLVSPNTSPFIVKRGQINSSSSHPLHHNDCVKSAVILKKKIWCSIAEAHEPG
jgi:hypothetical protein